MQVNFTLRNLFPFAGYFDLHVWHSAPGGSGVDHDSKQIILSTIKTSY